MNTPADSRFGTFREDGIIYVVDDDETDRVLLARALQDAGINHECRLFACGDELLEALIDVLRGAPAPILCFVDVKMAGMCGLDVLRWIRAQPGLRSVAVIMLSSSDHPELLSQALQYGAQCYVAKFPGAEHLREIVAAAKAHAAAASCTRAFDLPCNLLLDARVHVA